MGASAAGEGFRVAGKNTEGPRPLRSLRIHPDQVHISLPSRPPAEPNVQLPDEDRLKRAAAILGSQAQVVQASSGTYVLNVKIVPFLFDFFSVAP